MKIFNNSGYDVILYINGVRHSSVEYNTATNVNRTNLTLNSFFSYNLGERFIHFFDKENEP